MLLLTRILPPKHPANDCSGRGYDTTRRDIDVERDLVAGVDSQAGTGGGDGDGEGAEGKQDIPHVLKEPLIGRQSPHDDARAFNEPRPTCRHQPADDRVYNAVVADGG